MPEQVQLPPGPYPVSVHGLSAFHGPHRILDDISFSVEPGEVFVIMGASGAGKSSLLRAAVGLSRPRNGSVELLGENPYALPRRRLFELRKRIGVAFQGGALLSSMTVLENIELPLRQHTKLDPATIRIMAHLKLELLNLRDIDRLYPAQLSGGMAKRVSLARAVIMDPPLVFFDEPSGGLDPQNGAELDALILKLRTSLRSTFVVVTHALDSALRIADRIMVIADGRKIALGTPNDLRRSQDPILNALFTRQSSPHRDERGSYLDRLTADQ